MPQKFAHDLGISVVPLSVIFGDEVFREGIDIDHDLFYDKMAHGRVLPTTSAPSVGEFLEVYEPLLKETDEIVSLHLSSMDPQRHGDLLGHDRKDLAQVPRHRAAVTRVVSLG